ncbi:MAG: DUF305 domain-containing protein [Acidobacteria bacterium]|nr:DUF305 domain-containing protein [Acidobacteriota bacterium]
MNRQSALRPLSAAIIGTGLLVLSLASATQAQPPIVQPGAPGQPSRTISAAEASDLAGIRYTEADVRFMQGMISHHAQALEMTELLDTRTESDAMRQTSRRIELSQEDEIEMMQDWLRDRGQEVTAIDAHHAPGAMRMPGMLTDEEMEGLADADGVAFDRLFLEGMIKHHRGALTMVENLLEQPGAAQDSQLFAFTSDITADQTAEINRMDAMLAELSPDPRVQLASGFHDAGQALWNMALVATRPKPEGFYDPNNPAGRPMPVEADPETEAEAEPAAAGAAGDEAAQDEQADHEEGRDGDGAEHDDPEHAGGDADDGAEPEQEAADAEEEDDADDPQRRGLLNFGNTDLAFAGDRLFVGSYHGFNTYRVEVPASPQLVTSVVCPGGQGDVSVVGNLLIMSVEQTRGRLDCGLQGVAEPVSDQRFRGIRIFDIGDTRMPRQVAAVQTCRGSHTHTVIADPDDEGNVYVYGSGTGGVRSGEELEGCSDESPAENPDTALFRIDVIQVPLANPEDAAVVSRPLVFRDPETGAAAGLWPGGDHGPGTQRTAESSRCHDITTFPDAGLAAGACSGNGILFDISDPVNPIRLDDVIDPSFAYWHSATFNNDGTKVIFTDEWGGGGRPRCRASDPREWGANAIYDIVDGEMQFRSHYKLPAPQTDRENCVAHNGSIVPVPGRDIMVQAWYQGGISVFDFTDSSNPVEIAFFDRGPIHPDRFVMGGFWSAYWYRGYIYGTEIARGLDVLELLPSEYLTENEIAAAASVASPAFNAQQQPRLEWPVRSVVARAYLDQLERSDTLSAQRRTALSELLDRADSAGSGSDSALAGQLTTAVEALEADIADTAGRTEQRLQGLAETLTGLAERLR